MIIRYYKRMLKESILFLLLVMFSVVAVAQDTVAVTSSKPVIMHCPQPDELTKDPKKLTWSVGKDWQSYAQSFASGIKGFLGAQWVGIRVGQVICVYKGKEKLTFPIELVYSHLAYEPTNDHWEADKGGYRNCRSNKVSDCSFRVKTAMEQQNLYQEAEELKSNAPDTTDEGF